MLKCFTKIIISRWRSGEYGGCAKVSYLKFACLCNVFLATYVHVQHSPMKVFYLKANIYMSELIVLNLWSNSVTNFQKVVSDNIYYRSKDSHNAYETLTLRNLSSSIYWSYHLHTIKTSKFLLLVELMRNSAFSSFC